MATISLKSVVQSSKFLSGLLKPAAKVYAGAAGYQQIGKDTLAFFFLL
jgi:ubiquinol-cytochrome c reductase subunit 7